MLMVSRVVTADGEIELRHLTRDCLPAGPVPPEGRELTQVQINDASSIIAHAMSNRRDVDKDDRALGHEALRALLGHIVQGTGLKLVTR